MEKNILRLYSVLYDLRQLESTESAITSLTTLNDIISSSREATEFLNEAGAIEKIIQFLESDRNLAIICLKILTNAARRNENIRSNLIKNNIFNTLSTQIRNETDFSQNIFILYAALMVTLVKDSYDAKSQMSLSGCLSHSVHILKRILEEAEIKPVPYKNTQLIVYVIVASMKNPRHLENQTEVGWIIPKILEYLDKQTNFSNDESFQLTKRFWSLLKCLLEENEINQQIFLTFSGLSVLFSRIKEMVDEGKCEKMADLMTKMTCLWVKLKLQKEFLCQAYNYCSLQMFRELLKTSNALVVQHTIIFLDSLTQEIPHSLTLLRNTEIRTGLQRAKVVLSNVGANVTLCQSILNRMGMFSGTESASQDEIFSDSENFNRIMNESASDDVKSQYCSLHESENEPSLPPSSNLRKDFPLCPHLTLRKVQTMECQHRDPKLRRINLSAAHINFHRHELREQEKLRRLVEKSYPLAVEKYRKNSSGGNIARGRFSRFIQSFWSFFFGASTEDD